MSEMKASQKLSVAYEYWATSPIKNRKARAHAIKVLSDELLLDYRAVAAIIGVSEDLVERKSDIITYYPGTGWKLNPKTLDTLQLIAVSYEDDRTLEPTLIKNAVLWGTSTLTISALCGIPWDEVDSALRYVKVK